MVTVDDLPAVCAGLDCDYTYIACPADITSFSVSGTTLSMSGTNLPINLLSITYTNVPCTITSNGVSSISCTLSSKPVAGTSQIPQVID